MSDKDKDKDTDYIELAREIARDMLDFGLEAVHTSLANPPAEPGNDDDKGTEKPAKQS